MNKAERRFSNGSVTKANKRNKAVYQPDWGAKVAKMAFQKAKNKDFEQGHKLDEWLEAEQEFNVQ
jgi:Protein of unknown function (DUF2934)